MDFLVTQLSGRGDPGWTSVFEIDKCNCKTDTIWEDY